MDRVCPLLALVGDRHTAVDGVDAGHRCHATEPPATLERERQAQLCLTPTFERCERYLAYLGRTGTASVGRSPVADGLVSTRLLLAPEPAWRGIAGRARRMRSRPGALIGAGVAAVAIAGATLGGAVIDGRLQLVAATRPSPTPLPSAPSAWVTPAVAQSPTPAATTSQSVAPTATPVPSASPVPTPTPVVTPAPTPAPPAATPQATYVVREGDTLALIAQQFGTTVEALQAANGIEDPNQIVIGQVLLIP